jgi:predicted dinucleotide-binding enzyme
MNIAILGSDSRTAAIGNLLAAGGHNVLSSGQTAGDVLLLAGSCAAVDEIVTMARQLPPETIIIDAMDRPRGAAERTVAELLASDLGSDRIVRALIVLPQPGANVLCCTDDADAMAAVEEIFHSCGCIATDRGPLANADELERPDRSLGDKFDDLKGTNTVVDR